MTSNTMIIARRTDTGFTGRYIPEDGTPEHRVPLLKSLHTHTFAGDTEKFTAFVADPTPAPTDGDTKPCPHCLRAADPHVPTVTEDTVHGIKPRWLYLIGDDGMEIYTTEWADGTDTCSPSWNSHSTEPWD